MIDAVTVFGTDTVMDVEVEVQMPLECPSMLSRMRGLLVGVDSTTYVTISKSGRVPCRDSGLSG